MALDKTVLAGLLITAETQIVQESVAPLPIDPKTQEKINRKCTLYADAIYTWLLTATVNTSVTTVTTNAPGTVAVAGTAAAQVNPLPVVGTGSGAGVGTII